MVIAIVLLSLLMAIIIPTILLTRQSPQASPNDSPIADAATDEFLRELKPLLTTASLQKLDFPGTSQASALAWLLNNSNFQQYSFDRKVQRFAMAVFFYSTEGRSWSKRHAWITEVDECLWHQSRNNNICVNGTLQLLSLDNNALDGLLPNDIALLTSLTYLDLSSNDLPSIMHKRR